MLLWIQQEQISGLLTAKRWLQNMIYDESQIMRKDGEDAH